MPRRTATGAPEQAAQGARLAHLLLFVAAPIQQQHGGAWDAFLTRSRPFLEAHCVGCHGGSEPQADLDLARAEARAGETWLQVLERVELHEMPPSSEPGPSAAERRAFVARLTGALERGRASCPTDSIDPGRPVLRRLNNVEYENTVRALFGLEFPATSFFPRDGAGYGFDTVGEALSFSALRLEQTLLAAERVAAAVFVVDDSNDPAVRRMVPEGQLAGVSVLASQGDAQVRLRLPRAGTYRVRVRAFGQQAGAQPTRMALVVGSTARARFEVSAQAPRPQTYSTTLELEGGEQRIAARFLNDYYRPENPDPGDRDRNLCIAWIEVTGPLDRPAPSAFELDLLRRFGPQLGSQREAAILRRLVRLAWRRPARSGEIERLRRVAPGHLTLVERLRLELTAILASPGFLYLVEPDASVAQTAGSRALDDHELATRLSYFLWSTPPDALLDALADAGQLGRPAVLERAVRRMLADERADALGENFATQWLQLRSLSAFEPDPDLFPGWSAQLRRSMLEETQRFFMTLVREERSVWELVEADWTWVDATLAAHYGLSGVQGDHFRRVSLAGTTRRGLLGQASVLTVTSNPGRTSPVKRGKWILEVLLDSAPPPPPPEAGALAEEELAAGASLREVLARHRDDASCAVCHDRMDPLGLGLEHFDAIGAWRATDRGLPLDASGLTPDGQLFEGPRGLAQVLRRDPRFVRTLVERLLVYALGRGLTERDGPTVRGILAALPAGEPTLFAILLEIARSEAFTRRRVGD